MYMTQYERMVKGMIYDPGDPEIMNEQVPFQDRQWEFNQLKPSCGISIYGSYMLH